ncbi:MAG: hypothetical protein K6G11_01970 [Lachnospiraceae bacterium]|nr:hypothetical protein [Lachnospiraceae bacterium]
MFEEFIIRDRLFKEENMFNRVLKFSENENLEQTKKALYFMRDSHNGQFRKRSKYTKTRIQYISHPLMMACHAHALGINEDNILASILLHDVCEDTHVTVEELPFCDEVKEIVGLLTFEYREGLTKKECQDIYYKNIKKNKKACLVKVLDRCNNVSTMASSFEDKKMQEYILETEEYIFPLIDELKFNYEEYYDTVFIVKYHILSVIESIKCILASKN